MQAKDFLGFMSNLVSCLKLGRNTSLDEMKFDSNFNLIVKESKIHENKKNVVFILDNA